MKIADVTSYLERLAPPDMAMPDDPIGLHVGDPSSNVSHIAIAVDPTRQTLDRAITSGAEMLVCHHPLIYRPLDSVTASNEKGELVLRAATAGLAIYCMHTNWDCAPGGVNDSLAERLGIADTSVLSVVTSEQYYKVVVFVPDEALEAVRAAMCEAGGFIGNYSDCSFRVRGIGTYRPLEGAQPYQGEQGKLEQADEWRLETLAPEKALPAVIQSMLQAHPYEEVTYDIYPLQNEPKKYGLGRVGSIEPTRLGDFRDLVEKKLSCPGYTRMSGDPAKEVARVAICGGGGSSLIPEAAKSGADVYVSGDINHHSLLTAQWHGVAVIDAGHFYTEKPGMETLAAILSRDLAEDSVAVSYVDN